MNALDRDGLHSIQIGGGQLDVLLVNRGAAATLITFQHRISEKSTYPTLVGNGISAAAEMNLIAVSDPSVIGNAELRLGGTWGIGKRVHLNETCCQSLNVASTILAEGDWFSSVILEGDMHLSIMRSTLLARLL